MKVYLTLFLLFITLFTYIGTITADLDISNARDFKNQVVAQIEDSNLSNQVIEACKTSAQAQGYILETNTIKDDINRPVAVEITLKYNYTVIFLNVMKEHTLHDYAR